MLSKWADRRHHKFEKQVLQTADEVVTVSWAWAKDFQKLTGVLPTVITNGYDPEDFKQNVADSKSDQLNIIHIGSLNADRNPHSFWKAISELKKEGALLDNVKIEFIGPTDVTVFDEAEKYKLSGLISHKAHMSHDEVLKNLMNSDVLLLPLNNTPNIDGVIPGKLYEYLASRRPIITIGKPSGDAAKIILETGSGKVFDFDDYIGIKSYLLKLIEDRKKGSIPSNSEPPEKYSRKVLAGDICRVLDRISSK